MRQKSGPHGRAGAHAIAVAKRAPNVSLSPLAMGIGRIGIGRFFFAWPIPQAIRSLSPSVPPRREAEDQWTLRSQS